MAKKLNVRVLLQGTPYEDRAELLAKKIEGWGLDDDVSIHELPSHGMVDGINPNLIIQALLEQEAKMGELEEPDEPDEPDELDEPDWLKATPAALDLADEYEIDLSFIDGTGKDGTIIKSDVEKFLEEDEHDD